MKIFLEGKQAIQASYAKSSYKSFTYKSYVYDAWSHGSDISSVKYANWTAINNKSIITSPIAYFDKTYKTLTAL